MIHSEAPSNTKRVSAFFHRSCEKLVDKRYLKSRSRCPSGSIVMVTVMFSEIHPARMKCHFASSRHFRTSHREYFVRGMTTGVRPCYALSPLVSTLPSCSLSFSSFVIWFRGCTKIVFTLFMHLESHQAHRPASSLRFLFSSNTFGKFRMFEPGSWRCRKEKMHFVASSIDRLVIVASLSACSLRHSLDHSGQIASSVVHPLDLEMRRNLCRRKRC